MKTYLTQISWSFTHFWENTYDFSQAVREYQQDIHKTDTYWKPDEPIIKEPEIYIQYEAWLRNPNELMANEEFAINRNTTAEEKGYFEVEIVALLEADNGEYFTANELLYKTHQQMATKELGDHVFFEGFTHTSKKLRNHIVLEVNCGS
ncbi:hypothetical protein [Corynebacterium freiburgense]|uniref:hypothetical protein n=1 Tax=Corynebacterium freiburgense TaxID=556548 RepID=UPI0004237D48|nr:hypothetical protein [Corynebacterium freiburgense]WJZ01357.1 hypothetical protein CFREI_00200 [Corynebacterium freiburgense]